MPFQTSLRRWAIPLIVATLAFAGRVSAAEPEDELKSATVLMFLRYTEWPRPAVSGAPIAVGVTGRSSFVETLRRVLAGKSVEDRPIRIVDLKTAPDFRCCDVVYVATDKTPEIRAALAARSSARALTIGESEHFLDSGGAVNLFLIDDRISFGANLDALERAGLTVSSKLLRVGQIQQSRADRRTR